ncbi:peptidylprolyl isomerase [Buchnera aphidicola]|jgi:peptidyl-prolyl cis-trans isomerase D|uniref:Periplasmic chaperone PpiD n=1 Tax=Buchnera aphidicola subsp. Schizaphis graminum (strain Sg) TaxID=198804 RepID=PPID_BUCAP|nr:peptidylprolyl isomerase [Buchnera aphidicola]Q8K987.1 RecName: Full=Periplasmic chaperone PpiD; AltName: Full=Periplasmic folding chaperone [Buchnera aphidicola str. Sg (Schizaphis graminum)]AAM68005.1 peptidyl-prolyl cis-trans isomerase D [Buchnera aphidicola str. Sg (Schizaphis graminum)]AWI49505.1 peptidylprolyl isomerase [Buchnera aphidicola (Schizaphis graminum)]
MIKYLKSRLNIIIVKCILGIIILSLVFGTINNYFNRDTTRYIAKVNGEEISFITLQKMYIDERKKQEKILGQDFEKIKKNKKFKEETYNYILSQLINNILLEQYTKRMNFNIQDNEIKKIIFNIPIFQENNEFNKKKYLNYLSSKNLTHYEYVSLIRKKLNTTYLINAISETDFILDNEQKKIIKLLSEKRIIKKAIIKINPIINNQKVTEKEINNYFDQHKNEFYTPEKFKISYIQLKPNKFKIQCSNEEIKNWYKKNIDKYSNQERRQYSIIQTKTKNEALSILSELKKGEDFSKIAKEKSIDPFSSEQGGNIGWITKNFVPNEIKIANLEKIDQISNIIKFNNNFLIIKLNKILPKKYKKISEVSDLIENEIKYQKSLNTYKKLKDKIAIIAKKNINRFDLILKKTNILPKETNWFDKDSVPKELQNPILKKIIFKKGLLDRQKKLKSHSGLIVLNDHQSFLLSIKNFQKKRIKKLKDIKRNIVNKLKYIKAVEKTKNKLKKILFQLKIGNEHILKKENIIFEEYETVSRYDKNPNISVIFAMPHPKEEKNVYTMYQNKNKNFVIALLDKVYNEKFSNEEEKIIIKYLEKNNIDVTFQCFLQNLHRKATILYNKTDNF